MGQLVVQALRNTASCPYCRDTLEETGLVHCGLCTTRYHASCGDELKTCALLGCQGSLTLPGEDPLPVVDLHTWLDAGRDLLTALGYLGLLLLPALLIVCGPWLLGWLLSGLVEAVRLTGRCTIGLLEAGPWQASLVALAPLAES